MSFYNIIFSDIFTIKYCTVTNVKVLFVCLFHFVFNDRVGFFGSKNFPPSSGFLNPLN